MKKIYIVAIFVVGLICGIIMDRTIAPAMAEIAGMNYRDLRNDPDFRSAVEDIIEDCEIEDGEINC